MCEGGRPVSKPDALYKLMHEIARTGDLTFLVPNTGSRSPRTASPHQLMAIFGWHTLKEAERYTKAVEPKKIAARTMPLRIPARKQNESG
jgi:hypothetical protein